MTKLKDLYLKKHYHDEKLEYYFEATRSAIKYSNHEKSVVFTSAELMEVASKFFYCDQVFPDTTIQSHVYWF